MIADTCPNIEIFYKVLMKMSTMQMTVTRLLDEWGHTQWKSGFVTT